MIYVTADPHFNHKNIIEYCRRPFKDLEDMNEKLIQNWNQVVKPQDDIYILGDLCMGPPHQWAWFVNQLNGNKRLILGNHDNEKIYRYIPGIIEIKKGILFEYDGLRILMNHYPPGYPKNNTPVDYNFALCGHVHEAWKTKVIHNRPCYNVGVDTNNFTPVPLDQFVDQYDHWIP